MPCFYRHTQAALKVEYAKAEEVLSGVVGFVKWLLMKSRPTAYLMPLSGDCT